ncbi:hypothetical protein [Mycobacterium lacus]|uniref:Uncharacterized protein n=1 Tax=Mycobacterium lacus TaxID=169765 RepID=A0A1X1Y5U0_9MYCO|nr:hypothetical protein [Mycobacterium lacus]ORW06371.1 hypothetical protein AWC15_21835 [Mycobacterium lacus]BBX98543.1 hypothetical protein MLAC_38370 [Mycobacterium lacus]
MVRWGVLIAILIALIIDGVIQLAHGRPAPVPAITSTTTTNTPSPGAWPTLPSMLTVINLSPGL